jgi:hypothetical protein
MKYAITWAQAPWYTYHTDSMEIAQAHFHFFKIRKVGKRNTSLHLLLLVSFLARRRGDWRYSYSHWPRHYRTWVVSFTSRLLYPPRKSLQGTHWIRGWVGREKSCPCRESNPGRPAGGPSLHRLNYADSCTQYMTQRASNWNIKYEVKTLWPEILLCRLPLLYRVFILQAY